MFIELDLYAITNGIGTMIAGAILTLSGVATAITGPAVIFVSSFAGVIVFPVVLLKMKIPVVLSGSAGTYPCIDRALGPLSAHDFSRWLLARTYE